MNDLASQLDHAREEEAASEELLLTVKEYAALKRVHVQTVYIAIRTGRFKLRIEKPTGGRSIRIVVPRGSIQALSHA
jgi:hypothetical protein